MRSFSRLTSITKVLLTAEQIYEETNFMFWLSEDEAFEVRDPQHQHNTNLIFGKIICKTSSIKTIFPLK